MTPPTATGTCGPTATRPATPTGPSRTTGRARSAGRPGASTQTTGQWYLHHFVPEQPDLNWWNPDLVEEFDRILRFWFDRGAAGFRIDVCHMIVKDKELRDNPPVDFWIDHEAERMNAERPELHDVLRRWRRVAETYDPPRLLLGETYVASPARLARFYGEGDELQLAFNFPFFRAPFHAEPLRRFVDDTEAALPAGAWPVWTGSNHDHSRFPTRWAQNDPRRIRLGMLMLLCLRGTPVLYYGDEIGMVDTPITPQPAAGPGGLPELAGRWTGATSPGRRCSGGAGRGRASPAPTSPRGCRSATTTGCNVADQRDDPDSTLTFCRTVLALRREREDLRRGDVPPARRARGRVGLRPGRRHHRGVEPLGRGAGGHRAGRAAPALDQPPGGRHGRPGAAAGPVGGRRRRPLRSSVRSASRATPAESGDQRTGTIASTAENGRSLSTRGSAGSPSTRSPMMLRWISSEPPAMR